MESRFKAVRLSRLLEYFEQVAELSYLQISPQSHRPQKVQW